MSSAGTPALSAGQRALLNGKSDDVILLGNRLALIEATGFWSRLKLATPAASGANFFLAAVTLGNGVTTTKTKAGLDWSSDPDVVRNVILTVALAGGNLAGSAVLTGLDATGAVITESVALTAAGVYQSVYAYKSLTSVVLPARTTAGDTVAVGTGLKLGLPTNLIRNTLFLATLNGVREATFPTVTVNAEIGKNLVLLNSALNGTEVCLYWLDERD